MSTRVVRRDRRAEVLATCSKISGSLFKEQTSGRVVLGLDASLTKLGVSVLDVETLRHTTVVFKPKAKGPRRLNEIYEFVSKLVGSLSPFDLKHITLEGYAMGIRGGQTFSIGEGGGAVKLALLHRLGDEKIAYPTLVTPTALKKFVTGKGKAEKNQMLLAVYRKWGEEFSSDDQADAYALARVGTAILTATEYEYEAEVVAQLERHPGWQTS